MSIDETDTGELPVIDPTNAPCRHLRSKGMYVYTDGTNFARDQTDYDNTICWCVHTMKSLGPDEACVGGIDCRDTSRPCYEPV